ncbi:redoxin domain-containing protein [Streptomyces sp. NPDC051940]|uniref:peroxiredoxin family protein n=1 Tax=Streptomyces sp. NPDC051940 TaxID=3155675 RepID=UPI00343006FF
MQYLVAGIALVAAVAAVNAALTLAVVRRWRARTAPAPAATTQPAADPGVPQELPPLGIEVGSRLPDFTAVTVDGRTVSAADVAGRELLVAFLSLDCGGCEDSLPELAARARELRADGGAVLATVVGIDSAGSELAARVAELADFAVAESLDEPLSRLFGVLFYPGFARYGADGTARAAGIGLAAMDASALTAAR